MLLFNPFFYLFCPLYKTELDEYKKNRAKDEEMISTLTEQLSHSKQREEELSTLVSRAQEECTDIKEENMKLMSKLARMEEALSSDSFTTQKQLVELQEEHEKTKEQLAKVTSQLARIHLIISDFKNQIIENFNINPAHGVNSNDGVKTA